MSRSYNPSNSVSINPLPLNLADNPNISCCPVVAVIPGTYVTFSDLYVILDVSKYSLNPS